MRKAKSFSLFRIPHSASRIPEGLRLPVLVILAVIAGHLQLSGQAQQPAQPVFRSSTRLIVTTVAVKDRDGRAIEGLTAKDFIVTEDNVAQDIAFVEFQQLESQEPLPPLSTVTLADALPPPPPADQAVAPIVQPSITVPASGDDRFRNRRLLILYFDLSATPPPDQIRAYDAALQYIDKQMTPADLMAIMTYGGGAVRVKQDFTDNRATLREVIYVLVYGEDKDGDGERDPEDPSTAFGQNDAEFNIFNTDRQLSALQTAVTMLRPLPEQKSLIFFASNLRLNGTDNNAQLRATINAAIRANVQIFPVDARGLVASAPLGDANQRVAGGIGMFTGALAQQAINRFQRSQDTLYSLAKDTGGTAMFDYNDLSLGIKQAADAQTSYYIIGFYSTHAANDGKYRRVNVSLANKGLQAELTFRPGYFADKEWAKQSTADRERQLEEAMMLENPITDVTIALELNWFQLNSAEYFIPVSVKIPGSELELARRRGAKRLLMDVLVEVKDDFGSTQQNIRDRIEADVSQVNAELLITRPIQYETGFTLLPGKYVIKFLVRDAEAGRVGTFQTAFTIPNLNREQQKLPISSVVLASQRLPMSEALYSVRTTDKNNVGNPLILGSEKLVPSVTRVFSAQRDMYVYLQAYERNETEAQDPVVAFATFYRDGVKAFETQPVAVTDGMHPRSKAVPIRISIPLQQLPPARYDVQVTVLEPVGQKVAFWTAPIAIVP
jgi:VWFA-related protein